MKAFLFGAALGALVTTAALADTPGPKEFIEKAGASDTFEIESARAMLGSKNMEVRHFANAMITAHSKSTMMVKSAAQADHLGVKKPMLTVAQRADLTALKAMPAGKTKDDLYVKQQKAAHDDALALMQDYSANGTATHLKMTAGKIAPVVEMHQAMLAKM